jgi:hypothetical protein
LDRFFGHHSLQAIFFYGLKIADTSPDEAFVKGIFSLAAIDFFGGCGFYFAVGVKNVDDLAADEGQGIFLTKARISDRKVKVFHDRSP